MGITHFPRYLIYPVFIIFSLFVSYLFPIKSVLYASLGWWLIAAYLVIGYSKNSLFLENKAIAQGLIGLLVLVPCWLAVNFIRNYPNGISVLLFLFVLIWGADSGAYFVGRKWGKHKTPYHKSVLVKRGKAC